MFTSRCGSSTGSGRISRRSNSEKIAAFAPIPRARDVRATAVTNGARNSVRKANFSVRMVLTWTETRNDELLFSCGQPVGHGPDLFGRQAAAERGHFGVMFDVDRVEDTPFERRRV